MNDNELGPTVPRTPPVERPGDTKSYAAESSADPNRTSDHVPETGTVARTPSDVARQEEHARTQAADGVPGYVLLRELGRGGMGVVYEARHIKLNRVVALKMMLSGGQASRGELIRFLAEAEAVAAIRHENVVQVYDYGEANGCSFMALEFCSGGTIRKLLPENPRSARAPREMAALIAKVARGVAAAHALGIVHRDLKPGNVFLDADGTPKVADFGLAKRGEGANVTQVGQGMGTPAYMAPEQARDAKFVGPQADVWALGVILYEALTGTRPFTGTVQEILAKTQTTEPLPPRKVVPVPRDLELICLHCLAKAPHERYPTAKELADDLDRFLNNEPIRVRPAGALERGYKWVKRNKVVSGAATAVFLALLMGLGFSISFGREADKQAEEAKKKQKEADAAKEDAVRKTNEAIAARNELQVALARSLLGPINPLTRWFPLSPQERDGFWQLAMYRNTEVCDRFIEVTSDTPRASEQCAARADFAFHAAVGLDRERWTKLDALLYSRLTRSGATDGERQHLAVACSRWDDTSPRTAAEAAKAMTRALMRATKDDVLLQGELATCLAALALRMEMTEAARLLTEAIKQTHGPIQWPLCEAVVALAARMELAKATELLTSLVTGVEYSYSPALRILARALSEVVARQNPDDAARVCRSVAQLLSRKFVSAGNSYDALNLATGLGLVAQRLPPAEAAQLLFKALTHVPHFPNVLGELAFRLSLVAERFAPDDASATCSAAAKLLLDKLPEAERPEYVSNLVFGLSELVVRLEPAEAAKICTRVASLLRDAAARSGGLKEAPELAVGFGVLARRLEPKFAVELITDAMTKTSDSRLRGQLAVILRWAAGRLALTEAHRVCGSAAQLLVNDMFGSDADKLSGLAVGLGAVAERMVRADAAKVCDTAARRLSAAIMENTSSFEALGKLGVGVGVVANHMKPTDAATFCAEVVKPLAAALANTTANVFAQQELARAMSALAPHLPPAQAAKYIAQAIAKNYEFPYIQEELATHLGGVVGRLDVREATLFLTEAVADMSSYRRRGDVRKELARGFYALALGLSLTDLKRSAQLGSAMTASFTTPQTVLPSLPLLHAHFHPQPRPLPPQELVELLKHPFCVGEARRAVLDALEFTYKRPFKDQWEFVEYVQANNVRDHTTGKPLDLLTPPKRPEPRP